jgi:two-component system OmpR family response regulator
MEKVLVVDDTKTLTDIYAKMLSKFDLDPKVAYSGEECISIIKDYQPDLIILDIMMRPMDGWDTLRHIRSQAGTADVPVIMLTGKALTPQEVLDYGTKFDSYIMKPVLPDRIMAVIETVLEKRSEREAEAEEAMRAGAEKSEATELAKLKLEIENLENLKQLLFDTYLPMNSNESIPLMDDIEEVIAVRRRRREELAAKFGLE